MNPNIIAATIIAIGMVIHAYAPKPTMTAVGAGVLVGMSHPISNTHDAAICGPTGCFRWQIDTTEETMRYDEMRRQ